MIPSVLTIHVATVFTSLSILIASFIVREREGALFSGQKYLCRRDYMQGGVFTEHYGSSILFMTLYILVLFTFS